MLLTTVLFATFRAQIKEVAMNKISLAIHGGAGNIPKGSLSPEKEKQYQEALKEALDLGYKALEDGKTALEAVEIAVISMEDCVLFNAGRGSVYTAYGDHELDAAIMDGSTRQAGAVTLVNQIRNPVHLARLVLEKSEHVFLGGHRAKGFARKMGIELEPAGWFHDEFRYKQWQKLRGTDNFQLDNTQYGDEKFGTVGAVALDQDGNLAAATSTGGMTNKHFGRIGDSPIIGAGTYANNKTCAVSCTGSGEFFIRGLAAYDVSALMEFKGVSLEEASDEVIHTRIKDLGGEGGLIAVDSDGNISMQFSTLGMYRACRKTDGTEEIEIYGS